MKNENSQPQHIKTHYNNNKKGSPNSGRKYLPIIADKGFMSKANPSLIMTKTVLKFQRHLFREDKQPMNTTK